MEMKVWVCETWETEGYDYFGEHITLWYKREDAVAHGQAVIAEGTDDPHVTSNFRVWGVVVQ